MAPKFSDLITSKSISISGKHGKSLASGPNGQLYQCNTRMEDYRYLWADNTSHIHMGYWPIVWSRWLDIGIALFLHVYRPRQNEGSHTCNQKNRTRPISSILDYSWLKKLDQKKICYVASRKRFVEHGRYSQAGKIAPSCLLRQPITAQDLVHLAHSQSCI